MEWLLGLTALGTAISLLLVATATLAVWRITRRRVATAAPLPPVSILKPLKGLEADLEANLASIAGQDYPDFEILFAIAEPDDPAREVAARIAARFPAVPIRVVVGIAPTGLNPKVSNLAGVLPRARHELVLISDANVRARPSYLRETVAALLAADAALVSNPFVGDDEVTPGGRAETLHLATFVAPGVALAALAGVPCVVGKSMLLRRSALAAVGGLTAVADVLAEDYLLGNLLHRAGHRVALASHVLTVHNAGRSRRAFLARQLRWAQMRCRIAPAAYAFEPLLAPVPFALALVALGLVTDSVAAWALGLTATGLTLALDATLARLLAGHWPRPRALATIPLKDAMVLAVWLAAMFHDTVVWHGHRFRIGRRSHLHALDGGPRGGEAASAILEPTPAEANAR